MIVLVRHGRTEVNARGCLLGRLDPPLDDLGERQARALARALGGLTDPVIVTSPLRRATQTAAAIGAVVGTEPEIDERWIELDYGDWDGRSLADLPAETWRAWRADPTLRPPGGETLIDVTHRVHTALAELQGSAVQHDVVVVSHVSPIKAAVAWALGVGAEVAWRLFLGPAAITRIDIGPRGTNLVSFNETAHLEMAGVATPRAVPR